MLAFFGLTPQYRLSVFTQIHEIVFHGGGGYDWITIYNMPLWLRKFTYNTLVEDLKAKNKGTNSTDDAVQQGIVTAQQLAKEKAKAQATYSTKASKK